LKTFILSKRLTLCYCCSRNKCWRYRCTISEELALLARRLNAINIMIVLLVSSLNSFSTG